MPDPTATVLYTADLVASTPVPVSLQVTMARDGNHTRIIGILEARSEASISVNDVPSCQLMIAGI